MSDSITDALRDSERSRLDELSPGKLAERLRELRCAYIEYCSIKKNLEAKGWRTLEKSDGIQIWKELYI